MMNQNIKPEMHLCWMSAPHTHRCETSEPLVVCGGQLRHPDAPLEVSIGGLVQRLIAQ